VKKKILIAGGTGLIGSRLCKVLAKMYDIHILTRSKTSITGSIKKINWDLNNKTSDIDSSENYSIVINLTGAGIAEKRWTKKRKKELIDSRGETTNFLSEIILNMTQQPEVYIGASATGYYGGQGDLVLDETSNHGDEFLSDCCVLWEQAHNLIKPEVNRHIIIRIGIVLSTLGGAMKEIIKPAKLGVAGYFGDGTAYYSWIHIDDLVGMFLTSIEDERVEGIYNGVAKEPITIKYLTKSIKTVFAPIALMLPVPSFILKLMMGEMSKMLLNSTRVISNQWIKTSFNYKHPEIDKAIEDLKEREI